MSIVTSIRNAVSKAFERPAPVTPSGHALQNHLRVIESKRQARLALATKVAATRADTESAANAAARVERLEKGIDLARADARYAGSPEPDTSEKERDLADAVRMRDWYATRARAAETARARYLADIEVL